MCTPNDILSLPPKFDKHRRSQFATEKSFLLTMDGKVYLSPRLHFYIFIFLIFSFESCCLAQENPPKLKGGVNFHEEYTQGPVYINQQLYTLTRTADTSPLIEGVKDTKTLIQQLETVCTATSKKLDEQRLLLDQTEAHLNASSFTWDFLVSKYQYKILDAPGVCTNLGARLPEIRDVASREEIRSAMIREGIAMAYAGVTFDVKTKIFRFNTDHTNARTKSPFKHVEYGCNYPGQANKATGWEDDTYVRACANDHPVVYNWPDGPFSFRIADSLDLSRKQRILCVADKKAPATKAMTEETISMYSIVDHSCKRDMQSITEAMDAVMANVHAVTTLNLTNALADAKQSVSFFPQFVDAEKRVKRSAAELLEAAARLDELWQLANLGDNRWTLEQLKAIRPAPLFRDVLRDLYILSGSTVDFDRFLLTHLPADTIHLLGRSMSRAFLPGSAAAADAVMEPTSSVSSSASVAAAADLASNRSSRLTRSPSPQILRRLAENKNNYAIAAKRLAASEAVLDGHLHAPVTGDVIPAYTVSSSFLASHYQLPHPEAYLHPERRGRFADLGLGIILLVSLNEDHKIRVKIGQMLKKAYENEQLAIRLGLVPVDIVLQTTTDSPQSPNFTTFSTRTKRSPVGLEFGGPELFSFLVAQHEQNVADAQQRLANLFDHLDGDRHAPLNRKHPTAGPRLPTLPLSSKLVAPLFHNPLNETSILRRMKRSNNCYSTLNFLNKLLYFQKKNLAVAESRFYQSLKFSNQFLDYEVSIMPFENVTLDFIASLLPFPENFLNPTPPGFTSSWNVGCWMAVEIKQKSDHDVRVQISWLIRQALAHEQFAKDNNLLVSPSEKNVHDSARSSRSARSTDRPLPHQSSLVLLGQQIHISTEKLRVAKDKLAAAEVGEVVGTDDNDAPLQTDVLDVDSLLELTVPEPIMPFSSGTSTRTTRSALFGLELFVFKYLFGMIRCNQVEQLKNIIVETKHIEDHTKDLLANPDAVLPAPASFEHRFHSSTIAHNRTIRALPLMPLLATIGGGMVIGSAVNSANTGDAPFSWFGNFIGPLVGLATKKEVARKFAQLTHVATEVEMLKFGGLQLEKAINDVNTRVNKYGDILIGGLKAVITMTLTSDIKVLIYYMLNLLDTNVVKYSTLYVAASNGKTAPSALSSSELARTADRVEAEKGLTISRDLRQVGTELMMVDNKIHLVFKVPILDDDQLYHFYRVSPLPMFSNDTASGNITTLLPELDAEYIGISASGTSYVVLSASQFTRCTTTPEKCSVTSPIMPMNSNSHCIIATYISDKLVCPLVEMDRKPLPYMYIQGNMTVYSVPQSTDLFVKCSASSLTHHYTDQTITLNGMGTATFRAGCTVTFPDGTFFSTPEYLPSETMTDLKLFNLIRTFPVPTGVRVRRLTELPHPTELQLEEFRMPTYDEVMHESFHPKKSIPFLVRFGCILLALFVLGLIIFYYWRRCRSTCGLIPGCGFCTPRPDPKGAYVPKASFNQLVEKFNNLQLNLRDRFSRSTASLFPAQSTPNLHNPDLDRELNPLSREGIMGYPQPPPPDQQTVTVNQDRVRFEYRADEKKHPSIIRHDRY